MFLKCIQKFWQTSKQHIRTKINHIYAHVCAQLFAVMELLALTSAQVPLSYPLLARKRTRKPPFFFTFSDSSMSKGSLCKISEFLLGNEKTSLSDRIALRQCSGEKSIFFNNATNEILFGRKHCFYDLNIKMVHFCTFIMRLLWKLGKIAAILDSRRRKKRSQF